MGSPKSLIQPQECALLMVDFQPGIAFGVSSSDRHSLLHNAIALAGSAVAFSVPVVVSTSASSMYSGPLFPSLQAAVPQVRPIERCNMNAWEDDTVRSAIVATGRRRLLVAGLLTEACVSFPVLSALEDGLEVYVVADACGGLTPEGHQYALRRMEGAGAKLASWLQVLLEFQRDWTRHDPYDAARTIVESNGGDYGMGLVYSRDMIHPAVR